MADIRMTNKPLYSDLSHSSFQCIGIFYEESLAEVKHMVLSSMDWITPLGSFNAIREKIKEDVRS